MRQLTVFLACLALACYGLAGVASAGDGFFQNPFAKPTQASYSPGCVTPVRPDCGVPGHPQHCGCRRCNECCQDVPCQKVPCVPEVPKEGPPPTKEVPPQLEYLPKEAGAYVAPPRVGATRGAVVQRGVETGAITFPEIKLKFPCIEWPCCFASRTQAKMYVESGVAPWESHGIVNAAAGTNEALLLKRRVPQRRKVPNRPPIRPPARRPPPKTTRGSWRSISGCSSSARNSKRSCGPAFGSAWSSIRGARSRRAENRRADRNSRRSKSRMAGRSKRRTTRSTVPSRSSIPMLKPGRQRIPNVLPPMLPSPSGCQPSGNGFASRRLRRRELLACGRSRRDWRDLTGAA
jgi:hypothetical protein